MAVQGTAAALLEQGSCHMLACLAGRRVPLSLVTAVAFVLVTGGSSGSTVRVVNVDVLGRHPSATASAPVTTVSNPDALDGWSTSAVAFRPGGRRAASWFRACGSHSRVSPSDGS